MVEEVPNDKPLNISLAQWSHHKEFFDGTMDPRDFAKISNRDYDIRAIEYVNQFYTDHASNVTFWEEMKKRAENEGVKSLLIMTDGEGNLGNADDSERQKAIEGHYKWVNAAKILGCHSIRVNAFGSDQLETYMTASIDGMGRLSEYAAKENINIIIENHGLFSSNADIIVDLIKQVDMPNFGTFPDFGNWCMNVEWGSIKNEECNEIFNIYEGVNKFMPYAKAVSAKSYEFDKDGNETAIDYYELLKNIKNSNYDGFIGIEYEGEQMPPSEGIKATKKLMEKAWAAV